MRVRYQDPDAGESDAFCDLARWLLKHYLNKDNPTSGQGDDATIKLCRVSGEIHAEMKSMAIALEIDGTEVGYRAIRNARPTGKGAWMPITHGWMRRHSLPFVALHEPEKFYSAFLLNEYSDELAAQAAEVVYKASRIRIPRAVNKGWLVTHSIDSRGRYEGFRFMRKIVPPNWTRYFIDEALLNLFRFCEGGTPNKERSRSMSESFFREFRGDRRRWDQSRCIPADFVRHQLAYRGYVSQPARAFENQTIAAVVSAGESNGRATARPVRPQVSHPRPLVRREPRAATGGADTADRLGAKPLKKAADSVD